MTSNPPLRSRRLIAEAVGTFVVTATAIGIDINYYTLGNIDYASRWLARGFATSAVIYAFSQVSGAHVDPVVTIGFTMARVMPVRRAVAYIAAQFAGAFAAAALWFALYGRTVLALGASHPGPHVGALSAVVAETACTFVLLLTIVMTAQNEAAVGKQAALAVGFVVAACGFVAGPISGASMNPARSLAPQILAGATGTSWMYIAGPLAGTALAIAVYFVLCGAPSTGLRKAARGNPPQR